MAPTDNSKAEIVRRAFEGFQRLDMDAFTAAWHPDIVWDMRGYENWPGDGLEYMGEAEVIAGFAGYLGAVKSLEVSGLEVTPLEDGRVLGVHHGTTHATRPASDTMLDIGTVYEFSDDDRDRSRRGLHRARPRPRRREALSRRTLRVKVQGRHPMKGVPLAEDAALMHNVTHISPLTHSSNIDAPGGGYLDDAALITVLDHELHADKRFARSNADRSSAASGE